VEWVEVPLWYPAALPPAHTVLPNPVHNDIDIDRRFKLQYMFKAMKVIIALFSTVPIV
jgi:hypothetical protein